MPIALKRMHLAVVALVMTASLLSASGCTLFGRAKGEGLGEGAAEATRIPRARNGNLSQEGLRARETDLNLDLEGKPDQWTWVNGNDVVVRVERDLNFDGRVDLWQHMSPDGKVIEEELDLDVDGKVDVVAFYKEGLIARKLLSVGFTNRFTIEKFYDAQGHLLRIERDDDGDGRVDVWEYYENQRRVRIGWDSNVDGMPDSFDQLP